MKNLNKAEVLSMEQLDIVTGGTTFDPIDILKKELDNENNRTFIKCAKEFFKPFVAIADGLYKGYQKAEAAVKPVVDFSHKVGGAIIDAGDAVKNIFKKLF